MYKKNKMEILFYILILLVQFSCKSGDNFLIHKESLFGNNFRFVQRSKISKDLISNQTEWIAQCQKDKIDFFCWLVDKSKLATISDSHRLLIQQGPTSTTEMQIVVSLPKSESSVIVRLFDRKSKQLIEPIKMREAERSFSDVKNILLYFGKLQVNKNYELLVAASDGELLDEREVLTLPDYIKPLKFAIVSCANDFLYKSGGAEIWDDLWSMKPYFILEIGDNVYADTRNGKAIKPITEQELWTRYIESRSVISIYRKHQLIPIFAIWDDHDYGSNDGDRTFELKDQSLRIFKDFYAQEDMPGFFQNGPSVSSGFVLDGQQFLLLDNRYYRSVDKPSPVFIKNKEFKLKELRVDNQNYETHFGKEGEDFIFNNLNQRKLPTWLITGDQYFGGYHIFESYEGNHPTSFKNFLTQLRKAKSKVVFISGDRHLSELMEIEKQEIGYPTYEITSSGIHAGNNPEAWARDRNPRQLAGVSGFFNYTIIESQIVKSKMEFKVIAYKPNKIKLYEKNLKLGDNI
jgi:alkaline phosphatase D